jgi:hypothetical protein
MDKFSKSLEKHKACEEAVDWTKGKTLSSAYHQCDNPHWLTWLMRKTTISKEVIKSIVSEISTPSNTTQVEIFNKLYEHFDNDKNVLTNFLTHVITRAQLPATVICGVIRKHIVVEKIKEGGQVDE